MKRSPLVIFLFVLLLAFSCKSPKDSAVQQSTPYDLSRGPQKKVAPDSKSLNDSTANKRKRISNMPHE